MSNDAKNKRLGIGYKLFRTYVRLYHDYIYYRKTYTIGAENVPAEGALLVVSDHQNSLNDALGLVLAIKNRKKQKIHAIARADAFDYPVFGSIFRWIGLLPAFRMEHQGVDSLSHNTYTFGEAGEMLLHDGTVIIYPEAGHQDKHWLGKFSYGYLILLFQAAEKSNFKKELFILPSCNHYSHYFGRKEDILIKFGKPLSLSPYYELYKTKPRTACRRVNELVRQEIKNMMLHITDVDNYAAIDYLRNTYGKKYARQHGYNPAELPGKLLADRQFTSWLNDLKAAGNPAVQPVYEDAGKLAETIARLRINDENFDKRPSFWKTAPAGLGFLLLAPVFLFAWLSNALVIVPTKLINRRIEDHMLHGTIDLILGVLVTFPLTCILAFVLTWIFTKSLILAVGYLVCLPFLSIFVAYYEKAWKRWTSAIRFSRLFRKGKLDEPAALRQQLHGKLDELGVMDYKL
ncbi:MAG: 1-acyl-sn-glycerol-3-phosphate acyltransferase [Prevotellaceae bacterium]|jgi:1-acyl-sn-glycerol-3-phosphate acyltransferase|nr:1-acyl-sn-glycerol-3-phosphate acyltransferase [Prevotellaceae bacterium]